MTPAELADERRYRYEERLGILCGAAEPTPAQLAIAQAEVDEWEMAATFPMNFSGATSPKGVDNERMAATVAGGTAPNSRNGKCASHLTGDAIARGEIRQDVLPQGNQNTI